MSRNCTSYRSIGSIGPGAATAPPNVATFILPSRFY